jgi:Protein of unknown function (DUF3240)
MSRLHCSILCGVAAEERLLDALLLRFAGTHFTSTPTFVHGLPEAKLSTAEQVSGRARASRVDLELDADECAALQRILGVEFGDAIVNVRITSIIDDGARP